MVDSDPPRLDAIFHALGDATRRRMIRDLSEGPRPVSELAAPHEMSLAAASKHVKVLEQAGLLRREIQWRTHVCHLEAAALSSAHDWLERYSRFWNDRLDVLEALLVEDEDEAQAKPPPPLAKGDAT